MPENSMKRVNKITEQVVGQVEYCPVASKPKYEWQDVHKDLEAGKYAGVYGWDNAAYWGLAEHRAGVDLAEFYKKRTADECYLPEWEQLLKDPKTQESWKHIVMFDPMGMFGFPPSIAACRANLTIPELHSLTRDGKIVNEKGDIKTSKASVYYSWNIPRLAERLNMTEADLRQCLYKYSKDKDVLRDDVRTYIPAVGGFTVYVFGDILKLRQEETETTVRVHDECIGSDVFGSDICTCRPYLIYALQHAVETAQRGGVGIVVYFRKEGRSLGEVVKFRVYNARGNQTGGDTAEKYFHQTESIAGIRDARFQEMMPDALHWIGLKRIDYLMSMSNEKYEAIVNSGIKVVNRVSLADDFVPDSAWVELGAKIASGYEDKAMDGVTKDSVRSTLNSLTTIRTQSARLLELGKKNQLDHFTVHMDKLPIVAEEVIKVIQKNFPNLDSIPPHSRFRHFNASQLAKLTGSWKCDDIEKARRLVDLCFVSVLLDAGAGPTWRYISTSDGKIYTRSEGLGVATFEMFMQGLFSSDTAFKHRVNAHGLAALTLETVERGFQIHQANQLVGLEGRVEILQRLGQALRANPHIFGEEIARPGNMIDYLLKKHPGKNISVESLWAAMMDGLQEIWPAHSSWSPNQSPIWPGVQRGDIWHHTKLKLPTGKPGSDLIPFHKLSQWLCYSIMEPMEQILDIKFTETNLLTALPEYRNAGLLLDHGVLQLRDPSLLDGRGISVENEAVVEWRALTVSLMDELAIILRRRLGKSDKELDMRKILEGGSWRAGREIAFLRRAPDGRPPLNVVSDGTVF